MLTRERLADERGFSMIEMVVSTAVLGMFLAMFYGTMGGFLRDVDNQTRLGEVIRESRPVMREMVIELRQAVLPQTGDVDAIEELAWNQLVFFTDRAPQDGAPERFEYSLTGCAANICTLQVAVTQPDAGSAPDHTYTGAASTRVVLREVQASSAQPLFRGQESDGSTVTSCSSAATRCTFPVVRVDMWRVAAGGRGPFKPHQITEEVRLRNVSTD